MLPALALTLALAAPPAWQATLDALAPDLDALYVDLHRHPELSGQERRTAQRMAEALRGAGFQVTERVGGHGVVGVLANGPGPVVALRTDLDGLPVREATGLPYASAATGTLPNGAETAVMHACGHDLHMTSWVGAATLLARHRGLWRGTLVMVGQPAEETGEGARAMIRDGLFTRFPRPTTALALHQTPQLPAGEVGLVSGPALAFADSVSITVHGIGGHGAAPQAAVDPVLIAARIVTTLQGIVAREMDPLDPAVITVGSIHGGTKSNVIPDSVTLALTVRSYREPVQRKLLAAIARVARGEAEAGGAPRPPTVTVDPDGPVAVVNDPALVARLGRALATVARPVEFPRQMVSEDFAEFARAGIPSCLVWLGSANPGAWAEARAKGGFPPGLHTPQCAPDRALAPRTGAAVLTAAALEAFRP